MQENAFKEYNTRMPYSHSKIRICLSNIKLVLQRSAAMERLGGKVIHSDETSSSNKKGETIEDSVQVSFKI